MENNRNISLIYLFSFIFIIIGIVKELTTKRQNRLAIWNKMKSKGLLSHIVKKGLFCYGAISFLIGVFYPFIRFGFIYKETFKGWFILVSIGTPLYGIIMSYIEWKYYKKKCE
ncbi:hypothetical protein [Clostridium sediminicola]|uniref:hypothetical protein n=1 Tax=Clostridium sediminicola TaxID=3114879 RepID=UPI003D16A806